MILKTELIEAMARAMYNATVEKHGQFDFKPWEDLRENGDIKPFYLHRAQAALDAHTAFLAERGLKVVGREATDGMVEEGHEVQDDDCGFSIGYRAARETWAAMLAAAPDLFAETPDAG